MEWLIGGAVVIVLGGVVIGKAIKWGKGGDLDPRYYDREWENRVKDDTDDAGA